MSDPVIRLLRRMNAQDGMPQNDAFMDATIRRAARGPWSALFESDKPARKPSPAPRPADLSDLIPSQPPPSDQAIMEAFFSGIDTGQRLALFKREPNRRAIEALATSFLRSRTAPG